MMKDYLNEYKPYNQNKILSARKIGASISNIILCYLLINILIYIINPKFIYIYSINTPCNVNILYQTLLLFRKQYTVFI